MRDLYIILSVAGWLWCLPFAAFLWVRLRQLSRARRGFKEDPAVHGASEGRPEADV
jgi:hypothetical protein